MKRYEPKVSCDHNGEYGYEYAEMREDLFGDWVRWEDVEKELAKKDREIERLTKELEAMKVKLEQHEPSHCPACSCE